MNPIDDVIKKVLLNPAGLGMLENTGTVQSPEMVLLASRVASLLLSVLSFPVLEAAGRRSVATQS